MLLQAAPKIFCGQCCPSHSWKLPILFSAHVVSSILPYADFLLWALCPPTQESCSVVPLSSNPGWLPPQSPMASGKDYTSLPSTEEGSPSFSLLLGRPRHSYSLSPVGISWQKAGTSPQTLGGTHSHCSLTLKGPSLALGLGTTLLSHWEVAWDPAHQQCSWQNFLSLLFRPHCETRGGIAPSWQSLFHNLSVSPVSVE